MLIYHTYVKLSNKLETLPPSLELLHLYGKFDDEESRRVQNFIDQDTDVPSLLPDLRSVYIEREGSSDVWTWGAGEPLPGAWEAPLAKHLKGLGIQGCPE